MSPFRRFRIASTTSSGLWTPLNSCTLEVFMAVVISLAPFSGAFFMPPLAVDRTQVAGQAVGLAVLQEEVLARTNSPQS